MHSHQACACYSALQSSCWRGLRFKSVHTWLMLGRSAYHCACTMLEIAAWNCSTPLIAASFAQPMAVTVAARMTSAERLTQAQQAHAQALRRAADCCDRLPSRRATLQPCFRSTSRCAELPCAAAVPPALAAPRALHVRGDVQPALARCQCSARCVRAARAR